MNLMLLVFIISLLMLLAGAFQKKIQDYSITEPFLALVLGIVVGPQVLNLLTPTPETSDFELLRIACQFTIAMALMAAALQIPKSYFRRNGRTASILIIFAMIFMCFSCSLIFYYLLPQFTYFECLLLGAIITPTDPVVAATLITSEKAKKYLPKTLRNTLSFESSINDGLAFPLVILAISLLLQGSVSWGEWFLNAVFYQNILCGVLAYFVGLMAGRLMEKTHKAGFMSAATLLPFSLALSLILLSGFDLLNMNGIIAVFVGGLAFTTVVTKNEYLRQEEVQEVMERITTVPVFFILGTMLPWAAWIAMGWQAVALVILVLFLRRLPGFMLLMPFLPGFRKKKWDMLLMGWFGPIGVSALFYAIYARQLTGLDAAWSITALMVFASTVIHGLSSVPLEKFYYRKSGRERRKSE